MADTGAYEINPTAVANVTSHVSGLTSHGGGVVQEMETAILDVLAFAQIGSAVASANTKFHGNLLQVLSQVVKLLDQINQNVKKAAKAYDDLDKKVAHGYGANGSDNGGTPATPAPTGSTPDAPMPIPNAPEPSLPPSISV